MLNERYEVKTTPSIDYFEFESIGPRGTIRKVVRYSEINLRNFYNLGFGDKDELTGFISDLSVTNNSDSQKSISNCCSDSLCFYGCESRCNHHRNWQYGSKNKALQDGDC